MLRRSLLIKKKPYILVYTAINEEHCCNAVRNLISKSSLELIGTCSADTPNVNATGTKELVQFEEKVSIVSPLLEREGYMKEGLIKETVQTEIE